MQALKRFVFLLLATLISVASTSFAYSSNNGNITDFQFSSQLSELEQDQSDLHFVSNHEANENLLDVIVDFEEEEDEGKKKFSTLIVGIPAQIQRTTVTNYAQKQSIGKRFQYLQAQSIRLHLLIRRIQV